jgi:hypothetical protein
MKIAGTLRLLLTVVAVAAATALVWWVVGYSIGKGILQETGGVAAFQRAYGLREQVLLEILSLALVGSLALAALEKAPAASAGLWLGAVSLGAALLVGGRDGPDLSAALFVLAVAGVGEAEGRSGLLAAAVGGLVVAFVEVLGASFGTGEKILVVALRTLFLYGPLLLGPSLADRWLWRRAR